MTRRVETVLAQPWLDAQRATATRTVICNTLKHTWPRRETC
jgi:hypothetical protein